MKTTRTLLIQLPIPQLNFARQTGNIPLGAACLKMAADNAGVGPVSLLPQRMATYLGDAALLDLILAKQPDIVGFGVYTWNLDRSLYMARQLKKHTGRALFSAVRKLHRITIESFHRRSIFTFSVKGRYFFLIC